MRSPLRKAIAGLRSGISPLALAIAAAPPYVEPVEDPIVPPANDPITAPGDTPTDPATGSPEPGVDPDYVAPTRIEISDQKQTVIRTTADAGTWGNAYVATACSGGEYCEIVVDKSTPEGATLAVGFSTLDMPLNGIPGDLPGTIAWWSNGEVRQNGVVIGTLPVWGRGDRVSLMLSYLLEFAGAKGCAFGPDLLGDLSATAKPLYAFVGLYSTGSKASFKFAASKFACAVPEGYHPIGQVAEDPHFWKTTLLVGFDGADGEATFLDESPSPKVLTNTGGVVKRTGTKAFGTASGEFDGADAYLSTPDSADWTMAGAFTVEAVVSFASAPGAAVFVSQYASVTNSAAWTFRRRADNGNLEFGYYYTGSAWDTVAAAWTPEPGQFYHVVAERNASNVLRLYVDGVMIAKKTGAAGMFASGQPLWIGAQNHASPYYFGGFMDELRLTNGVARYDSDAGFAALTGPFPRRGVPEAQVSQASGYAIFREQVRTKVSQASGYAILRQEERAKVSQALGYAIYRKNYGTDWSQADAAFFVKAQPGLRLSQADAAFFVKAQPGLRWSQTDAAFFFKVQP